MSMRLGVIGGRETYELLRQGLVRSERRFAINTPFGQAGTVFRVTAGDSAYFFLPRQGEENDRLPPSAVNYRANVYAMKELGVQGILAWSGATALTRDLPAGGFVLPDDLVDFACRREGTFFEKDRLGIVRQSPVFCPTLRIAAETALKGLGHSATAGGTYVCIDGPRLETPAEARLFASWGSALLGMTLCPEVFLARELGMCYAALCYVTGHAEGLGEREYVSGSLYRGLAAPSDLSSIEAAVRRLPEVMPPLLAALADVPEDDACRQALTRSREPGLDDDWHTWLQP